MTTKPRKTEEERIKILQANAENARKYIINKSDIKTAYEEKITQITDEYEDIITKQKTVYEEKLNNTIETMTNNFNKQLEKRRLKLIAEHTAEINRTTEAIRKENEASNKEIKQDIINYYTAILDDKNNMINYFKDMMEKTLNSNNKPPQKPRMTDNDLLNGSYSETLKARINNYHIDRIQAETFGGRVL